MESLLNVHRIISDYNHVQGQSYKLFLNNYFSTAFFIIITRDIYPLNLKSYKIVPHCLGLLLAANL